MKRGRAGTLTRRGLVAVSVAAAVDTLAGCAQAHAPTKPKPMLRLSTAPGSDPTGEQDSSDAVQRFVKQHASRPIVVDGMFRMDDALLLPSGTSLTGRSTRDGFRFTWSGSTHGGHYIGNLDPIHGNHDIRISKMTIQGAGTGLPAGASAGSIALSFRRGRALRLTGLRILNAPSIAIAYQGVSLVRITDNVIDGSGRDGITGWWYSEPLEDVIIARNQISRMGDDAIAINASAPDNPNHAKRPSNIRVYGNTIQGHTVAHPDLWGRGILVLGSENVTIEDNTISDTAAAAILISSDEQPTSARFTSREIRVVGNKIRGTGRLSAVADQPRSGVFCTSSSAVTIDRNLVDQSREHGILLSTVTDVSVTRNSIANNGTSCTLTAAHSGVTVAGSTSIRVDGNTLRSNASNGIKAQSCSAIRATKNTCANNGRLGDSRTPLSAGIWILDSIPAIVLDNTCTQDEVATGHGRQSWGVVAPALATETAAQRDSNTSVGAAVGGIYSGLGDQARLDLWAPSP